MSENTLRYVRTGTSNNKRVVYFIQASNGAVKIGYTKNPKMRLCEIRRSSPLPVELVATLPGGHALELKLHEVFHYTRLHGEWFSPSKALLKLITKAREGKPTSLQALELLCLECDCPADTLHHVVPKSRGGTRTVPLCTKCHRKIHRGGCATYKPQDVVSTSRLTREAMRNKKRRGERVGRLPYGFRLADDGVHVEPDEIEQTTLSIMLGLRHCGLTIQEIADTLNLNELPTRNRRGSPGKWSTSSVWLHLRLADVQKQY